MNCPNSYGQDCSSTIVMHEIEKLCMTNVTKCHLLTHLLQLIIHAFEVVNQFARANYDHGSYNVMRLCRHAQP